MSGSDKANGASGFCNRNLLVGIWLAGIGVVIIGLYSLQQISVCRFWDTLGVSLSVALGALAFGLFLGFLFGVPRTGGAEKVPTGGNGGNPPAGGGGETAAGETAATPVAANGAAGLGNSGHQVNTNLQEISDWLTKIIVGVSLIELGNIVDLIDRFGGAVQIAFPEVTGFDIFIDAVLIIFFFLGLLFGFLWTRLQLQTDIRESDQSLVDKLERKVNVLQGNLKDISEREAADAKRIRLIEQATDWTKPLPPSAELHQAIVSASVDIRRLAFFKAHDYRRNAVEADKLDVLDRVVPVFEALIEADKKGQYHRNYAELGYIYKDKDQPDYRKAVDCFTKAIEIRDQVSKTEKAPITPLYEYNRALAAMKLSEHLGLTPKEDTLGQITEDLNRAVQNPKFRQTFEQDAAVKALVEKSMLQFQNDQFVVLE